MDAFFASVEQRDNPELKGKPIVVGGTKERGVVSTASYEARVFGVRSAMSGPEAYKLCKELIYVKPRFSVYKETSEQILAVFKKYTNMIEQVGLDEAYLDVSESDKKAITIAKNIKSDIFRETKLTSSAGVSINKFLAKVASDYNKPNGLKVIMPDEALSFTMKLDIAKIPGIGKVTKQKMNEKSIYKGKDLADLDDEYLFKNFGKSGVYFKNLVLLKINDGVKPFRNRKSLAKERTFSNNLISKVEIEEKLSYILDKLIIELRTETLSAKTITLKIKFNDFVIMNRSKTLDYFTDDRELIFSNLIRLLEEPFYPIKPIRLLGIHLSNFGENTEMGYQQLELKF